MKCVYSVIRWFRLYSNTKSFILLGVRWAMLQLKSAVMIMSGMSVLQTLLTPSFKRSNNLNYYWVAYKNHQLL